MNLTNSIDILRPLATVAGTLIIGVQCSQIPELTNILGNKGISILLAILTAVFALEGYYCYDNKQHTEMLYHCAMLGGLIWAQSSYNVPQNGLCIVVALATGGLLMPLFNMPHKM